MKFFEAQNFGPIFSEIQGLYQRRGYGMATPISNPPFNAKFSEAREAQDLPVLYLSGSKI